MAIYNFFAKVVSRANGSSAVASAAYRAAERLTDERLGRDHDFTSKAGVVHSQIMLPEGAPERLVDRETLWNAVEAGEVRKDAQLARDFVAREFVVRGMIADLNVHWDKAADGSPKPHVHVMLTMREVGPDGFGQKERDWNSSELLQEWRRSWADQLNTHMAELGLDGCVDHRTLEALGIPLEPQHKIGAAESRREMNGEDAERADDHMRIARENGGKIIADPAIALNAITHSQAAFTLRDLAQFVFRHNPRSVV